MDNKGLFRELYDIQTSFELKISLLDNIGVYTSESFFSEAFYAAFEVALCSILNETGRIIFYEDIIYKDYSIDKVMELLEDHFK